MDHLFSPWRHAYVTQSGSGDACVFCTLAAKEPSHDASSFILQRARHHFLILNIYPYNNGHLMIVPYQHAARLSALSRESIAEMFDLAARVEQVLADTYKPEGINLGMNLGRCAGAGIAEHLHLHVVPRWTGDTSFMTVSGGTRVLPEDLAGTWSKLQGRF